MKDFVTEKEAANKLCPWMSNPAELRYSGPADVSEPSPQPPTCVGSGCMAWRWSHQDNGPTADPTGFCGQAGLPKYV